MKTLKNILAALVAAFPALIFLIIEPSAIPTGAVDIPANAYNIVKFYDTRHPIITAFTTEEHGICKDDIMWNISNTDIFFLRGFKEGWKPPTLMRGVFWETKEIRSVGANAMNVTSTGDKQFPPRNGTSWNSMETILFAYSDYICGVFRVDMETNGGTTRVYDVRVRNANNMTTIMQVCYEYAKKTELKFKTCPLLR
uniref:Lipocalin n=1 Tax=Rhipicephalus appendiculatus TaxID=34631 RepID=A0A131YSN5_RHIAP